MIPEIHNIIVRWNKEADVKNTGVKIRTVYGKFCQDKEIIVEVYTDRPGLLIGKRNSIFTKYENEIKDFYAKWNPKAKVTLNLVELTEIVGQEEVDIDKYYSVLIKHVEGF